jgi:actin-related protein 6
MSECCLVVDSGFSFTHVTPIVNGKAIWSAVKRLETLSFFAHLRLNVGGKFLTNYLKEIISYRHYNMMEETHLINRIKESCCFVSQDFSSDLEKIKFKKGGEVKYVLPDYSNSKEGYILKEGETVKEDQQILTLGNERFAIPEVLFTPSDVG